MAHKALSQNSYVGLPSVLQVLVLVGVGVLLFVVYVRHVPAAARACTGSCTCFCSCHVLMSLLLHVFGHVLAAARACTGSLHVLAFLLFVARASVLAVARSSVLDVER